MITNAETEGKITTGMQVYQSKFLFNKGREWIVTTSNKLRGGI